jgi:hypothetical protein
MCAIWAALIFASFAVPEARLLTSSGQDLPGQGLVQAAFGAWAAAAAAGLWRRVQWGWYLATVLAVYQLLSNLLGAVLSDVITGDAPGDRELVLIGAAARLLLWLAVGLVLHGHRMTLLFELPWAREEERKRSSRVFTYALAVLAAMYLLARYMFGPGQ